MKHNRQNTIFLFDVDGTLTPSRQSMPDTIKTMLSSIRTKVNIGFVGGSDISKQKEQMGSDCLSFFDFAFPENGLSFYETDTLISQKKIIDALGEDLYKKFVNFCLKYLSEVDIPIKRGNFIEYRNSMINISPIGRNCSLEERKAFKEYDSCNKVRLAMVESMKQNFDKHDMHFSIGGEISIDCFMKGWDKRYCIQHIHGKGIKNIYFFGDMTHVGGNDYEIYMDERVVGIAVKNPSETIEKVNEVMSKIMNE